MGRLTLQGRIRTVCAALGTGRYAQLRNPSRACRAEQMKPKPKGLELFPLSCTWGFGGNNTISDHFVFCFKFLNRKNQKGLMCRRTTPTQQGLGYHLSPRLFPRRKKGTSAQMLPGSQESTQGAVRWGQGQPQGSCGLTCVAHPPHKWYHPRKKLSWLLTPNCRQALFHPLHGLCVLVMCRPMKIYWVDKNKHMGERKRVRKNETKRGSKCAT